MPLAVVVFQSLDVVTTWIGQANGMAGLGPTGPLAVAEAVIALAAGAATMWSRRRSAVALAALTAVLSLTAHSTGMEVYLAAIIGVTAGIRATWRQLGLVTLALVVYEGAFAVKVERRWPGEGLATLGGLMGVVAAALAVGLVACWLLGSRDRRRLRVRMLEQENEEIRAVERARLADELQSVVTQGLAAVEAEADAAARPPADAGTLRRALTQVDLHSRSLLNDLRVLLDALRCDEGATPAARANAREPEARRWVDLLTARAVRIVVTSGFMLLAARAAVHLLAVSASGSADGLVQVGGWVACAVAVWRPVAGAGCAAGAVAVSTALHAPGYWDAVSTTLLCLVGAVRLYVRWFWVVVLGVAAYACLLAFAGPHPTDHVLLISYVGFLAICVGLAARHLMSARTDSLRRLTQLGDERDRMGSEERSAVARELHDVVAHQLSVTTMLVMATSHSDDCGTLTTTLAKVRRSTEAARHELSTLLHSMRGPDAAPQRPAPLESPLTSARALAARLAENGHHPVLDVDPAADGLDTTTQRTLGRIMQEAATNILRYTPAGSTCRYTLAVDDTGVRLDIVSPLAAGGRGSDLSLGWGLRGIRERVELTEGTFTAGPDRGHWLLAVTLPVAAAATEAQDRLTAASRRPVAAAVR